MFYRSTLDHFAETARAKSLFLEKNPLGFAVSAVMAGGYIGLGIVLIFSLGYLAEPAWRSLVMGASFGIALTLVVFAGAELFTGHVMYMTVGLLQRSVSFRELAASWVVTWLGNLLGALGLAVLLVLGSATVATSGAAFLQSVAATKMASPALELVMRAALCNWLVCLALWMSARTENDAAKCMVIFWCLLAFIASGFEHSIANMAIFAIALLSAPAEAISLSGAAHNLLWVTLGNILSGCIFMGLGYWFVNGGAVLRGRLAANASRGEQDPA